MEGQGGVLTGQVVQPALGYPGWHLQGGLRAVEVAQGFVALGFVRVCKAVEANSAVYTNSGWKSVSVVVLDYGKMLPQSK